MLDSLYLGNFKAFAETQRLPIKPITLVFGPNSSGKSSLIHGLLFGHHALKKGVLDVHHPLLGENSVDLGGFRQFIHKRQLSNVLEWGAELDAALFQGRLAELLAPVLKVGVSVTIQIEQDNRGNPVPNAEPVVQTYEIQGDGKTILRMSRRRDGRLKMDRLEVDHPALREIIKSLLLSLTTTEKLTPADYEGVEEAVDDLIPHISASGLRLFPLKLYLAESEKDRETQHTLFPISQGNRKKDLANVIRMYLPRILDELVQGLSNMVNRDFDRLKYLGPLRSFPPRHLAFSEHDDPNWNAGGGFAYDILRKNPAVREAVNRWLGNADRLNTPYELILRELIGLDQIDEPLLEGLENLNTSGLDLEHEPESEYTIGGSWPIIKDPEGEIKRFHHLIQESGIDKIPELLLFDHRTKTMVSHRDVGIGISQVLPVLALTYAAQGQIISIEQPEIHLHPKLQAELGDVFIESALGERKNTFIIETHSEHLLLRIMRRMRETFNETLKDPSLTLHPNDVMVLYIEPDGSRSIVREIPLNEAGELVKAWPGGFFEEGLREVF